MDRQLGTTALEVQCLLRHSGSFSDGTPLRFRRLVATQPDRTWCGVFPHIYDSI